MQVMVKHDIGAGSGSSAINGAMIVENRAKRLQTPKAVAYISGGKSPGIAR